MPEGGATRPSGVREFSHRTAPLTAVLLVQLGTPDTPERGAVRRYLKEFLSDRRVVEIPQLLWWPLLNGVILNTRPAQSASRYKAIWTDEGSPLAVHSARQARLLKGYLGQRGFDVDVVLAMRYGNPSFATVMGELRERHLARLLVLPLYPQYAASTTATAFDALAGEFARWRNLPELRFVRGFHDHPGYIESLAALVRKRWDQEGRPEQLVMSFHGVPRRTLELGDPYHCECLATGRLLAERLGLSQEGYRVTFQSRLGRAEWLKPYTEPTLVELAGRGVKSVDVICPGFVSDNLETLEEIGIEARAAFMKAGGQQFRLHACPNDSPAFVHALADIVGRNLSGWPVHRLAGADAEEARRRLEARQQRAKAAGAPD